jgi:hypothetical protein
VFHPIDCLEKELITPEREVKISTGIRKIEKSKAFMNIENFTFFLKINHAIQKKIKKTEPPRLEKNKYPGKESRPNLEITVSRPML